MGESKETQENWLLFKKILLNIKGKKKFKKRVGGKFHSVEGEVKETSHWDKMMCRECTGMFSTSELCSRENLLKS